MKDSNFNAAYIDLYNDINKKIKEGGDAKGLLKVLSAVSLSSELLDPIDANLTIKQVGAKGRLKCEPDDTSKYNYKWDHAMDGLGAVNLKCDGNLHTGYSNWSGLWHYTHSAMVYEAAGIPLVFFFKKEDLIIPIGHFASFNPIHISIIVARGEGKWEKI